MRYACIWRRVVGVVALLGMGSITACSASKPETKPPVAGSEEPPACTPTPASEEKITVRNPHGTLEGTLVVPEGCGALPIVLIIAGSGPTNRDGNAPRPYRLLADGLAARGVASLRYDKGGVGASAKAIPAPAEMRFEMGVDDAALFIDALRADSRFGRLVVAGHSEGSLIGIVAARRTRIDAFASLAGAGRPGAVVLREQLARNINDATLLAKANEILAALERGERVPNVPKGLEALFAPTIQGYLSSWIKYDPAEELRTAPLASVLVAQGTTDIQVSTEDAKRLAASRPDARLLIVERMNHVLKEADMSSASQQKAYADPTLPVVPEVVDEVATFARAR